MKDLQAYVQEVWETPSIDRKKEILHEMITTSTASKKTKVLTRLQVDKLYSPDQLDKLAINYSFSGMGLKVIK
jgi:hypothetical protein